MLKCGWIVLCSVLCLCAVGSSPIHDIGSVFAVCWVFAFGYFLLRNMLDLISRIVLALDLLLMLPERVTDGD